MRNGKVLRILLLGLAFGVSLSVTNRLRAEEFTVKANCDLPEASLFETKAQSEEECKKLCADKAECGAALYITGWKKCALKKQGKKTARLKFQSAELGEGRVYQKGSYKDDNDYTGKDLERLVLESADACGEACAKNAQCETFTYLDGYRVCWLKKTKGKFVPKVFSCLVKGRGA